MTTGCVGQISVFGFKNQTCFGMIRVVDFGGFFFMAATAVFGGDESRDACAFVHIGIGLAFFGFMAVQAGDVVLGVLGHIPLFVEARALFFVAGHAFASKNLVFFGFVGGTSQRAGAHQHDEESCYEVTHLQLL